VYNICNEHNNAVNKLLLPFKSNLKGRKTPLSKMLKLENNLDSAIDKDSKYNICLDNYFKQLGTVIIASKVDFLKEHIAITLEYNLYTMKYAYIQIETIPTI